MKQIKAPADFTPSDLGPISIFLGGSIEMGTAPNWQEKMAEALKDQPVTLLNPRRPDWDSTWTQDPEFEPFRTQVIWEQYAIKSADIVVINFCEGTMSPISLLELGVVLGMTPYKLFVICPKGYQRSGNVLITCALNGVRVYENIDDAITGIKLVVATAINRVTKIA